MGTLAILLLFLLVCLFLSAVVLWLGAIALRLPKRGIGRSIAVVGVLTLLSLPTVATRLLAPKAAVFIGLAMLVVTYELIRRAYQAPRTRAALQSLLYYLTTIPAVVLALFVVRPFVLEAFEAFSNGMAPSIVGEHRIIKCPQCGGPMIVTISPAEKRGFHPPDEEAFCPRCLLTTVVPAASVPSEILPADRVMVNKLIAPRRWDILAYTYKNSVFLKRVVALPGETLVIDHDGNIRINGEMVKPPDELPGWRCSWPEDNYIASWPTGPDLPIHLGADEYFVVGDWAKQSLDSRADGPLHRADIVGVATVRYWPLSRFHVFR